MHKKDTRKDYDKREKKKITMMMMMVIDSICIKIGSWRLLIKYIVYIQLEKKTLCVVKTKTKKKEEKKTILTYQLTKKLTT